MRRHNRPAAAPLEKTLVMFIDTSPCFKPNRPRKILGDPWSVVAELKAAQTTQLNFG